MKEIPLLSKKFSDAVSQDLRLWLIAFIAYSLTAIYVSEHFYFDQYIGHVQGWHLPDAHWTESFFFERPMAVWTYFIIDVIWAFLLILLTNILFQKAAAAIDSKTQRETSFLLDAWLNRFPLILFIAYLIDLLEFPLNIGDLFYGKDWASLLNFVFYTKLATYGIAALLLVIQLFRYINQDKIKKHIYKFLHYNNLSILVIAGIVLLMQKMEQGGALLDRLLDETGNLLGLFLILNILVWMTWHWPYYHNLFDTNKHGQEFKFIGPLKMIALRFHPKKIEEHSQDSSKYKKLFSVATSISYKCSGRKRPPTERWYHFQRMQASLVFILAIYILSNHLAVAINAIGDNYSVGLIKAIPALCFIILLDFYLRFYYYYYYKQSPSVWFPFYRRCFYVSAFFQFLFLAGLICADSFQEGIAQIAQLTFFGLALFASAFQYLALSIVRTDLADPELESMMAPPRHFLLRLSSRIFAYDYNFMFLLSACFLMAFFLFVFCNISYTFNEQYINGILVILFFVVTLFGISNTIVKIGNIVSLPWIKNRKKENLLHQYQFLLGALALSLAISYVIGNQSNPYHQLTLIDNPAPKVEESGIALADYLNEIPALEPGSKDSLYYIIVGDGGGLRAAYWNLLVMQRLDSLCGFKLFDRTLAITGVSGGMIGQGAYFALKNKKNRIGLNDIRRFGKANFLSNDLSFFLGKRLLTPFGLFQGTEDSSVKMARAYMEITNKIAWGKSQKKLPEIEMGFRQYWQNAYDKSGQRFPLLFVNTTQSESGIKGIAAPLQDPEDIFKSSISIVDFPSYGHSKTIRYADALFTSNRFILLSPAAEILSKGHFLDGGYFDNSGISSIIDWLDYIKENPNTRKIYEARLKGKIALISIMDGKAEYIQKQFGTERDSLHIIQSSGEAGAILSSASSLSTFAMPVYWSQRAKQLVGEDLHSFTEINIPFLLTRTDVQSQLKGQVKDLGLDTRIKKSNDSTLQALARYDKKEQKINRHYIIDPPLSRVLSPRITHYMEAVCQEHFTIKGPLNALSRKE